MPMTELLQKLLGRSTLKKVISFGPDLQFDPATGVYYEPKGSKGRGGKNQKLFWDDRVSGWRARIQFTDYVSTGPKYFGNDANQLKSISYTATNP